MYLLFVWRDPIMMMCQMMKELHSPMSFSATCPSTSKAMGEAGVMPRKAQYGLDGMSCKSRHRNGCSRTKAVMASCSYAPTGVSLPNDSFFWNREWPAVCIERTKKIRSVRAQASYEKNEETSSDREVITLPIFPLGLVAMPAAETPLHIFEARYRVLFRQVHRMNEVFALIFEILIGHLVFFHNNPCPFLWKILMQHSSLWV